MWRISDLHCAVGRLSEEGHRPSWADVLVIDDFAMTPITEHERRDLFEVLDDRHDTRSTIISSQIPPKRFHDYINEPTHADAICDRLIHTAHKLVLKGPSRRKPEEPSEK
jgi:DNA replication protein DnaC